MNESWTPSLTGTTGTLHGRVLHALRRDIAAGTLCPGGKMPPHRELSRRLGIGVGTVTRAYGEAERLGLLTSAVGRGTFVARTAVSPEEPGLARYDDDPEAPIDLSLNLPTGDAVSDRIGDVFERLRSRSDLGQYVAVAPHAGIDWHRQALADWLRRTVHFGNVDWSKLVITTGAQQAMSLCIDEMCRPGDVVLTEAATFGGIRAIAAYRELHLVGVAMDRDGIIPAALDDAIGRHGARVLYLQPTLQNPTTRTIPMSRRQEVAAIARARDLTLIEDDVDAATAFALDLDRVHADLVPLAMIAPERIFYISSVSKSLTPGPRVGMVVAPDRERFDRLCVGMRATCYASGTLGPLIVAQWIKDGTADEILSAVAREAAFRLELARRMLGDAVEVPLFPTSLHVWLPMPELRAERVANGALRRGVVLTPPASFLVNGEAVSGLRLCLNVVTRRELERALRIVRSVLSDEVVPRRLSIV